MVRKHILLINPWIYDFKAFDFWMKPLGLLYVASILRKSGYEIHYLDLLDRYQPVMLNHINKMPAVDEYGRGKFYSEEISKPTVYCSIPRRYKRYGMPPIIFREILSTIKKPDYVFVTSIMTYWYPAVFDVIKILKEYFQDVPIVLGGIYTTLCFEHAQQFSGADIIIPQRAESALVKILPDCKPITFTNLPYPAFDLYVKLDYACLLTSQGCPFSCSYCAVPNLSPTFLYRDTNSVIQEIEHLVSLGVKNIAFYDDALLANPSFSTILDEVIKRKITVNFHSPNGLHPRFLTQALADRMFNAGFKTIYLSLESINPDVHNLIDDKVTITEFSRAVNNLLQSGFTTPQIHAYLMIGMPEIPVRTIKESIDFLMQLKITPHLAEFSPIPNTYAFQHCGFSKDTDPLLHNNTIFPALNQKQKDEMIEIKTYLSRLRLT